jgi:hypothetical protein
MKLNSDVNCKYTLYCVQYIARKSTVTKMAAVRNFEDM